MKSVDMKEATYPKLKILYKVRNVEKETTISAKGVDKAKSLIYISESESAKKQGVLCGKIDFIKVEEI